MVYDRVKRRFVTHDEMLDDQIKQDIKTKTESDTRFCIRLPPELREDLREAHEYLGGRESDIIRKALRTYLDDLLKEAKSYEEAQKKLKRILEEL